jgi:hypothetical protein
MLLGPITEQVASFTVTLGGHSIHGPQCHRIDDGDGNVIEGEVIDAKPAE